jgi:hypothetical protein
MERINKLKHSDKIKDIYIPMVYPNPIFSKISIFTQTLASEDSKSEHMFCKKKGIIGVKRNQTYSHHSLLPPIS